MLHQYDKRAPRNDPKEIVDIKQELLNIGEMRPGSLTRQYKDPRAEPAPTTNSATPTK